MNTYQTNFAQQEKFGGNAKWVDELRESAMNEFSHLGFPTTKMEEWRRTDVSSLSKISFAHPTSRKKSVDQEWLDEQMPQSWRHCPHFVFVNGTHAFSSDVGEFPEGPKFERLKDVLEDHPGMIKEYLGQEAPFSSHPFVALNTAYLSDGAFISIPKGKEIAKPIYIVHVNLGNGEPFASYPRNLIIAEPNSKATVISVYLGQGTAASFTNSVTEVFAQDGASIHHIKFQQETEKAFHLGWVGFNQKKSNVYSHSLSFGGGLVRNEISSRLLEEGSECTLNGLYVTHGKQLVDHHTTIDHVKPHCQSQELYKGILDQESRGVFNGKIIVRQDAQKTNSSQSNKNLILSEDALVDTTPQLEIYADDVKCAHGATIGKLDENELFYLRSRGIDQEHARNMLIHAFASEVVRDTEVQPLHFHISKLLTQRFSSRLESA